MKKSGPKLNKFLSSKLQGSPAKAGPETVDDYIEEAALDEESGDRWHGSDLAKGLRFYQKAFEGYKKATQIGTLDERPSVSLAYYNASRLLFHVYEQYQKADAVQIADLKNVEGVLAAGDNSVVQDIQEVIRAHESTIEFCKTDAPTDLLFNAAMVYMDAMEETETLSEVYAMASRSMALLKEVLARQVGELKTRDFSAETGPDCDLTNPSDVIETVIAALTLAQTLYESTGSTDHDIQTSSSLIGQLVTDADMVANEVFNQSFGPDHAITEEQRNEYLLAKAYASAASSTILDEIFRFWGDDSLPDSPERYMSAGDCIDSFLQRSTINSGPNVDPEAYWVALSKVNQYMKVAQEALNKRLQTAKTGGSQQLGIGGIISQLAKVYIARSDVDLQRSQLPLEQATNNQNLLLNNAKAFLKNAMNLAKQTGGIRETAVEKVQRERRRIEAVCRLCVLEGKNDAELDTIVGAGKWQNEIEGYRELWYFPARG